MSAIPREFVKDLQAEDTDGLEEIHDKLKVPLSFEQAASIARAARSSPHKGVWSLSRIAWDNSVFRECGSKLSRAQLGRQLLLIGADTNGRHFGLLVQADGAVSAEVYSWDPLTDSRLQVAASVEQWVDTLNKAKKASHTLSRSPVAGNALISGVSASVTRALLRRTLLWLCTKRCSGRIPRMGPGTAKVDCYEFGFRRGAEDSAQIEQVVGDSVIVRYRTNDEITTEVLLISDIDPNQLLVKHYWGDQDLTYTGLLSILVGRTLKLRYLRISCRRLFRRLTKKLRDGRAPAQESQLQMLQAIADSFVRDGKPVSAFQVMTSAYGSGWPDNPNWTTDHDRLKAFLDVLAQTGDLSKSDQGYSPTGSGMKLIELSEREDRKHRSATRVQLAIAFAGLIQMLTVLYQAGGLQWAINWVSKLGPP